MSKLETIDPTKFAFFERRVREEDDKEEIKAGSLAQFTETGVIHIKQCRGVLGAEPNTIHRWRGEINDFHDEATPIPDGYEKVKSPSEHWIKKYFFNPKMKYVVPTKVPEYDQEFYFIHDNGGRPFVVYLNDNFDTVYRIPNEKENQYTHDSDYRNNEIRRQLYQHKVYETKYQSAFIGKSPLNDITSWGGGHGPKFDGNSILLHLGELNYVQISISIKTFTSLFPITEYHSDVGNNDVPYPYAKDSDNNLYMLLDDVIMKAPEDSKDPYRVYYDLCEMLAHNCVNFEDKTYKEYKGFYIGDESYLLRWESEPARDFQRMKTDEDKPFFLMKKDGTKQELTEEDYVSLMNGFAEEHGLHAFETVTVVPRDW
jgi:hypothetical protein